MSIVLRFVLTLLLFLPSCVARTQRVEPLLQGWVRQQLTPFNQKCPQWTDSHGYTYERPTKVGCVATALESIISYHGRDVELLDTLWGWRTPNYVVDTLLPSTRVKVSDILPRYEEGYYTDQQADAVALLSLICGTAARMRYGLEDSGANPKSLLEPMQKALGWKSVKWVDSYVFSPENWRKLLRNELQSGRPVFYTGYTMNGFGHAFVLDGVDELGRFHFNFGFGGAYDSGWFHLDSLAVFEHPNDLTELGIKQGFSCNHTAILLAPDSVDFQLPDTLSRTGNEVLVEQLRWIAPPVADKFTPFEVTLRNTTDKHLTTPFALFTNIPTDTLVSQNTDFAAIWGATLRPYERITLTLHGKLKQPGERVVYISPDDKTILWNSPLYITPKNESQLHYENPSVHWVDEQTAHISVTITNTGTQRCGELLTFCLMPTTAVINEGDVRHYHYAYLRPGETRTYSVTFRTLQKGEERTFALRNPWAIRTKTIFVHSPTSGTSLPLPSSLAPSTPQYDVSGRRFNTTPPSGIVIREGKKQLF